MLSPRRAFTLIELLVVIAIIAVLAAILFPVFASAKAAAKKTVDLSNVKQVGLATQMYATDHEDAYPLAVLRYQGQWYGDVCADLPSDWEEGLSGELLELNRSGWGNSIQPYLKSFGVLQSPVLEKTARPAGCYSSDPDRPLRKPFSAGYAFNGLLHNASTSSVARPSQLMAFSQPLGKTAIYGMYYSSPFLICPKGDEACRYVPSEVGCGKENGGFSGLWFNPADGYQMGNAHSTGSVAAYADGSARFVRLGANLRGRTDYHTDPYSRYHTPDKAFGVWADENQCHLLLFRPDFDFADFGTPVEWVAE